MKINDVRPVLLTHPYGSGLEGRRSACFVEVETDGGITGVGETYAGVYVPEVAAAIVELFKPLIVGQDPTNPEAAYRVAYRATSYFGRTGLTVMVLSGIENALWDIAGQARGVPVHALLGGAVHDELPVYGSGGPFTMSIPELVGQAADTKRRGLRGFKMRINFFRYQPEVEIERVAAVREALGRDMALAIDAVQNYKPQALVSEGGRAHAAHARTLQPGVGRGDVAALRSPAVRRAAACDVYTHLGRRGADHGGAIRAVAPRRGLRPGTARRDDHRWDRRSTSSVRGRRRAVHSRGRARLGISADARRQHPCGLPSNCVWVEHPVLGNPLESELFVEPLVIRDGHVQAPTAPGPGICLTADVRAKYPFVPGSGSVFGV
jgi:L-alanine-DL-glutamate epimerase-like enolase superfamily enzyme